MPDSLEHDIERELFSAEQIRKRVTELGQQITEDYAGKTPLMVCILRGASIFLADLVRCIDLPVELNFMAVTSYGNAARSSGVVRIIKDLDSPLRGRDVIVVEDVLDSGLTLKYLSANLGSRSPNSLEIATLLLKNQTPAVIPRYVGFDCPNEFVVGYGLDYAEHYRNLPYIGVLKREVYSKK